MRPMNEQMEEEIEQMCLCYAKYPWIQWDPSKVETSKVKRTVIDGRGW